MLITERGLPRRREFVMQVGEMAQPGEWPWHSLGSDSDPGMAWGVTVTLAHTWECGCDPGTALGMWL